MWGCFLLPLLSPLPPFVPDVDECAETEAVCGGQGVCTNTLGSYACACPPGYRGNGMRCEGKQLAATFHGIQPSPPPPPPRSAGDEAGVVCRRCLLFAEPPPGDLTQRSVAGAYNNADKQPMFVHKYVHLLVCL